MGTTAINGMVEYKFLNSDNELINYDVGIINGYIYRDILTSSPQKLTSAYDNWTFANSKCSFAVYNDKLFIANGKDYVWVYDGNKQIVSQMGAPEAEVGAVGNVVGDFAYAITYTTAGGEEVVGSISNIVHTVGNKVELTLPLGYAGCTARKIYRAYNGIYSNLDLLATISDNTTLTYTDNTLYVPISTPANPIPAINNELPKPYFLQVFNNRLIGCVDDKAPTQLFITEAGLEVFDSATFTDISNFGDDNTAIVGMGIDFSTVIVGTQKNVYLLTIDTTISVSPSRVNTGFLDGYSVVRLPAFADFTGGLMFVSSNYDIRILNGLDALPVSTSINNVRSNNWAQNIRGSLDNVLRGYDNMYAIYYNYKYHLVIDGNKFVFDIRTNGWTYHNIETENYESKPYILAILRGNLYNGQVKSDATISDKDIVAIEQEYMSLTYKGEEVPAYIESPQINVSDKYKFVEKLIIWFIPSEDNEFTIKVICDDETEFVSDYDFQVLGGAFSDTDFLSTDYEIYKEMDYKIFNIQKPVRWFKFRLENNIGMASVQGWGIYTQEMQNKE
jgi:hypothetical protein